LEQRWKDHNLPVETVEPTLTPEAYLGTVRLPAQWGKLETLLLAFPVNFPPLWHLHAQMIAAIVTECAPTVHVPHVAWAHGIALSLQRIIQRFPSKRCASFNCQPMIFGYAITDPLLDIVQMVGELSSR
jgi:hypothetical protein